MRRRGVLLGSAVLLAAVACAPAPGPPTTSTTPPTPTAVAGPPLEGTTWKLQLLGETAVGVPEEGRWPTLTLDQPEGLAKGFAGCNGYSGVYELKDRSLRFGPLIATKMACPQLGIESAFVRALESTRSWSLVDGKLELRDAAETPVARFEPFHP